MVEQALMVRVWGKVQGVGFRYFTREQALLLGLRGYACNQADGSVEILLCGPAPAVQQMREWLAHGPPTARVTQITSTTALAPEESGFYCR
ncbi:acylphosphatase [Aeromonas cavernicola]|uniref:acylphosphatase n=1 Tax=Aeromonas cavernicola TaxID=1006623 RepID=A0A2H9U119_9GAMM|nr:acylphosphatase [Aeromonas cavernicola]PJG57757.1 acylphosphatase [Aeromonas cavernicola]